MKVVTFYSYKGGTGRTLLLANTALFLASAGKRVVALDLDLEAPGLPYKFDLKKRDSGWDLGPGIVGHLSDYLKGAIEHIDIWKIAKKLSVREGTRGSVFLIPAGPAPANEYATALSQTDWHSLYWGGIDESRANAKREGPTWSSVFGEIRRQIETELRPEYLLIDSRTGLADISGVALNFLPDIIVCLMLFNDENMEGARQALRGARAVASLNKRNLRILPLVTRIPSSLSSSMSNDELAKNVMNYLVQPSEPRMLSLSLKSLEKVQCLHSEPKLEVVERLLSQSEDITLRESALLRDYLSFFECLDSRSFKRSPLSASFSFLNEDKVQRWLVPTTLEGEGRSVRIYRSRESMMRRIEERKNLRVVEAHFLPRATSYNHFCKAIAQHLRAQLGVSSIDPVPEKTIDYDLLGFQMREGRFDFCAEAYFLTPLRSELSDLLEFGWLRSFLLVHRRSSRGHALPSKKTPQSMMSLEIALDEWGKRSKKSNCVLHVAFLGDTAATSASSPLLVGQFSADQIHSLPTLSALADYLSDSIKGEIRLGLLDHGVFARIASSDENKDRFATTVLALPEPLPVGFLLPPADNAWRRELTRVVSAVLLKMGPKKWSLIRSELLKQAHIDVFSFDDICKYLSLDMTLSEAYSWLRKTVPGSSSH